MGEELLPKRGQQWSYLDRGRTFSVGWALTSLWFLAVGVYVVATRGEWLLLGLGVACLALSGLFAWENERQNRPPIPDEDDDVKEASR